MRTLQYELCADEAWTHGGEFNRYWCFFGGLFGPAPDIDRLESLLRSTRDERNHKGEIKWSAVTGNNLDTYKALVDIFFDHLHRYRLTYRQMFLDRTYVHVPKPNASILTPLDVQFRLAYQFLKHTFGLRYLCDVDKACKHEVTIRFDNHSSQTHKDQLTEFAEQLTSTYGASRLQVRVQFVNSKKFLRLQLCDLLMGAAGSHGNKMHLRRADGKRGMTPKQKWRKEMASYIYNKFREIDHVHRGSNAFNWFESTGGSHGSGRLTNKISIWKFKPTRHQIDEGWQNDYLDKQGRYQGPRIIPAIISGSDDTDIE